MNNDKDDQQKDSITEETGIEGSDDEEAVYCFCRRPAGNEFMILCKECEEWFHGDCVGITRVKGDQIMNYYCMQCRSEDPSLKIIYKPEKEKAEPEGKKPKRSSRMCGMCKACFIIEDCGKCVFSKDMKRFVGPGKQHQKCLRRQCKVFSKHIIQSKFVKQNLADDDDIVSCLGRQTVPVPQENFETVPMLRSNLTTDTLSIKTKKLGRSKVKMDANSPPTQCQGPGCIYASRPHSKYCSDECGIQLAMR